MKSYADMSGTIVGTTASANIDGVSSKDSVKQSALILLGNKGGVTGDIDVNVINFNTASYLIGSGKTHVVVSWINNIDPVAAPIVTQTLDATVVNNAIKVTIPWNYASDAFTIAITPYNPSAPTPTPTATPGNVYQAEEASLTGGAKIMTDHTGYTGTGFVAGYEFQGPATTFMINAASQAIIIWNCVMRMELAVQKHLVFMSMAAKSDRLALRQRQIGMPGVQKPNR